MKTIEGIGFDFFYIKIQLTDIWKKKHQIAKIKTTLPLFYLFIVIDFFLDKSFIIIGIVQQHGQSVDNGALRKQRVWLN